MKHVLETPRLLLRQWNMNDVEAAFKIYGDPTVMHYIGKGVSDPTPEVTHQKLARIMNHYVRYGFGLWAMVETSSGEIVGTCGLKQLDGGLHVELSYHIRHDRWGMGYATEGARACVQFGFKTLGLHRIVAVTNPNHQASIHVLEKTGLRSIGYGNFYRTQVNIFEILAHEYLSDVPLDKRRSA